MVRLAKATPAAMVLTLMATVRFGSPAGAGERVTLSDGGMMEAEAVSSDGRRVKITLPGGGDIWLPVERVVRVEQFRMTPAAPPVAPEAAAPTPGAPPVVTSGVTAVAPEPPRFSPSNPEPTIRSLITFLASPAGVDARLVEAMVRVESNFDPYAVSHRGAMGLMQLMPGTAARYEVSRPFDAEQNLRAGIAYLKDLLARYGKVDLALAAYNAGEEAVDRHGGIPPYRETRAYVHRILKILQS